MRIFLALALSGLSLASLQADEPKPNWLVCPPKGVLPVGPDFYPGKFLGEVVGLTDETITIKPGGDLRIGSISFHPDGTIKEKRLYIQDNTKSPKLFVFSDELHWHNGTRGIPPRGGVSSHDRMHKISDVRTGDIVFITCSPGPGFELCVDILIMRRFGGQVPLTIGDDKRPAKERGATMLNAEQAREEMLIATFRRLRVLAR